MKIDKIKTIGFISILLICIQAVLFIIKQCIFIFIPKTNYSDHMASMAVMIFLTFCIILITRKLKINLSIFPRKFNRYYICISIATAILLIITPSNYTGGIKAVSILIYSSIVTPMFEEIIFRGYVWNKLNAVFSKEWVTYIVSTIIFALWHFGYISSIAFRVNEGLINVMIWKVITGFCFGVVLGFVRLKTKNCYSSMLMHGVLNLFAR